MGTISENSVCKYLEQRNIGSVGKINICANDKCGNVDVAVTPEVCGICNCFESKNESIEHPDHYCDCRKYEPVKVIQDWDLSFCLGNVLKYISRAGRKPGNHRLQDLLKAKQYLEFEIGNESSPVGKNEKEKVKEDN